LYLFIIYKIFINVIHFDNLFSAHCLIYNAPKHTGSIRDLAYLLTNYYSNITSIICLTIAFLLAYIGLFKKSNYFTNTVLWLSIINLNNYLYPTLTAGDYLLNQLLLFNIFFSFKPSARPFIEDFKIAFHNAALIGIKVQICLAYFLAALFKLNDVDWLDGSALWNTIQIPEYSNSLLTCLPISLCTGLTYLTIIYQLTFPVMVFMSSTKKYVFTFGIIQHLIIALAMGLFSFGIIMMMCYILFLKYDDGSKTTIQTL
jgi:hypothetical protein